MIANLRRGALLLVVAASAGCGARSALAGEDLLGQGGGDGGAALSALVAPSFDTNGPCSLDQDPSGAVFVLVANRPISCAETSPGAFAAVWQPGSPLVWEVCLALPPALLHVGTVSLADPAVSVWEADTKDATFTDSPVLVPGTLSISAVGDTSVTFTIAGSVITSPNGMPDANGTYTAPRCP